MLIKGGEKIDWANPVDWAAPMETNVYAVRIEGAQIEAPIVAPEEPEPPKPTPPARSSSWIGGRRRGFLSR